MRNTLTAVAAAAALIFAAAASADGYGTPGLEWWGATPDPAYTDWKADGPNHWRRDYVRPGKISGETWRELVLADQPFICNGPVNLDLVKVEMHADRDAVVFATGCTGRIGRLEVDTWTQDGVKVQNASVNAAHDVTVAAGYVTCHAASPFAHQDGIQAMGGARLTFTLKIDCPFSNAHLFINRGGSGATTPTDIVCDGCYLGPRAASHGLALGTSVRSGARNTVLCRDRTGATPFDVNGATNPVNQGNSFPASC